MHFTRSQSVFAVLALAIAMQPLTAQSDTIPRKALIVAVKAWTGKYPYQPGPGGPNLWSVPAVRSALSTTLGSARYKVFNSWSLTEGPVQVQYGHWVKVEGCKGHDCGPNNMEMYVDLRSGGVITCWTTPAETRRTASGASSSAIPADACQF